MNSGTYFAKGHEPLSGMGILPMIHGRDARATAPRCCGGGFDAAQEHLAQDEPRVKIARLGRASRIGVVRFPVTAGGTAREQPMAAGVVRRKRGLFSAERVWPLQGLSDARTTRPFYSN